MSSFRDRGIVLACRVHGLNRSNCVQECQDVVQWREVTCPVHGVKRMICDIEFCYAFVAGKVVYPLSTDPKDNGGYITSYLCQEHMLADRSLNKNTRGNVYSRYCCPLFGTKDEDF